MKRFLLAAGTVLAVSVLFAQAPGGSGAAGGSGRGGGRGGSGRGGGGRAAAIQPKPEDLARVKAAAEQIEAAVQELKAKHADADQIADVDVYAKAGRFMLEFPELVVSQQQLDHAFTVMDAGIERAKQLQSGHPADMAAKSQLHAYYSEIDGSVQPYHVTLPANYDPSKPTRLYVWLHGRQNNTTELEFMNSFMGAPRPPGPTSVADQGQIQVDCFGRINGGGWHFAGEADVFEAIAAVKKRFKIDEKRIALRGFSMGGEGGWNVALHYPDTFAAAEIGAGTWSRRAQMPGLQPWQYPVLKLWENMEEWALNAFNMPLAGHDGDRDDQIPYLPGPAATPNRGQLESSLRTRAQLEKEGFPSEGAPDFLRMKGTPDIFLLSLDTGHGTSALTRQRLDAFLKEWEDRGQVSPDHNRFITYTTRYNHNYWVTVDGMDKLYERADVDALRKDNGATYEIKTTNVSRLVLREMENATTVQIDGQTLKLKKGKAERTFEKTAKGWAFGVNGAQAGLHKIHALQGPIDDAFIDPFLIVKPTGTAWNDAVNQQALRAITRFDRLWAKYFRGHPLMKNDKDVTAADMAKYHVVLFGDPGSNTLIAKMLPKLPVKWTKETVTVGAQSYPANVNFPALVYPNPMNPLKYVVVNTALTIDEREYNGDYGMPKWGDYAVASAKEGSEIPDLVTAGFFDNNWKIAK